MQKLQACSPFRKMRVISMHLTDYHAKYFAYELTKRCSSDSIEKLAGALVNTQVDLNPHQVEAALFPFKSPLSKGALLADEVGLGKTIEAGLVISQKWAERKRRILIITPANLRKQWHQEIQNLERRQRKLREDIFEVEDQILAKRDQLLEAIRGKLRQSVRSQPLFMVRWSLSGSQRKHSERREHVLSV
jgi:SNF2 family DNA or RNA helicase